MSLPATFRAYEISSFGDVNSVVKMNENTPLPTLKPNQVLVHIVSTATNPIDYLLIENPSMAKWMVPEENWPSEAKPMHIGFDFSGTIAQIGEGVTGFQIGDEVYGNPLFSSTGSFSEYYAIDAKWVARKPKSLSYNEAAAVLSTAQTSYQALIDGGKLQAGQRLLILGGSSATGGFAIQIAKNIGATVITTTSARNIELVKSYGADQVIDYTSEDWAEVLEANSIDLIYDCGAESDSWNDRAQRVLKEKTGRFITIGSPKAAPIESPIGASYQHFIVSPNSACLDKLTALIDQGKLKPTIDSVFQFDQLLEALAKQKTQRARGKIIVEVDAKHADKS